MIFEAIALSEKYPKGRISGTLQVINHTLCFIDTNETVSGMPVSEVKITQGGAGNRYIYFTHDQYPGLTFYTDDKAILNIDEIRQNPSLKAHATKIKNNRRGLYAFIFIFFGLIISAFVALYVFRGRIVEHMATLVSPKTEQEMAESLKASAIAGKSIVKDSSINARLAKITSPLVNAVENKDFKFTFTIIKDETLNAFALPGGTVIIHSGLIEKAKSPEEVAGVLAHEISHVTRRHHVRSIIGNLGIWVVLRGLIGDMTGVSAEIATVGATLGTLKYSRGFETESDDSGFELLERAKVNPQGMIDFFSTLQKEHGSMEIAEFMSTHPATDNRIENLKSKKQNNTTFIDMGIDFKQFQKDIKTYFNNK